VSSFPGLTSSEPNAVPRFRMSPDPRRQAAARRKAERDICRAVEQNEFILHYQPRYSLSSGAITGMEALVRWPDHRQMPSAVVSLAEQTGSSVLLGGWMLNEACCAAAAWPVDDAIVSVSVSARQIEGNTLLEQVACALDRSGLPADRLELGLAKSRLIESGVDMLLMLSALRDLGVGLALDDFGSGCASLSLLRRLPLTAVKLDRSLVQEVPRQGEGAAIAGAVVQAGHAFGLTVVADGVEREEQRAFLAAIGCDEGQGSLLSQPLPPERLRAALKSAGAAVEP